MLAEFSWEGTMFLGVLTTSNARDITSVRTTQQDLPELCTIFGPDAFVCGYEDDYSEVCATNEKLYIIYLPTFAHPTKTYECVRTEYHNNILKMYCNDEAIQMTRISQNRLLSFGFDVIKDGIMIKQAELFHQETAILLAGKSERTVNGRKIYYLKSNVDFISSFVLDAVKKKLQCTEIEQWNAFASVIPPHETLGEQQVHRDCLSESVSLFFYLDDVCAPRTHFYPFTHRIVSPCSTVVTPALVKYDILIMDGLLLHGGAAGTNTHDTSRILYVVQYRNKRSTRQARVREHNKLKECIENQKTGLKTVFTVR